MTTYNYYIGLQDKDHKEQFISTEDAMAELAQYLTSTHDGATLTACKGCYRYNDMSLAIENTIKITLFDDILEDQELNEIKEYFNQECIAVEVIESRIAFV